jgi:hypothetical protein
VAIQHFLFLAAGVLLLRQTTRAWCFAFFLMGLALWNKALAAWTLVGLAVPLLAFFPIAVWKTLTVRRCALALAFFAVGAFPFLRYNVRKPAATVQENVNIVWNEVPPKASLLYDTLRGYGLMDYITYDLKQPPRWTFIPHALSLTMVLLLIWPQRLGWYPIAAGAIIFILMAMTRNAGGAVHHQVLIWPLQYWAIAAAFTAPEIRHPWAVRTVWIIVAMLALDNARVLDIYRTQLITYGSPGPWNNAIQPLAERIKALNPRIVRIYDWGMSDNLLLLTQRTGPVLWNDRPYRETLFGNPDDVWIGSIPPFEAFANTNRELREAADKAGYDRQLLETIHDRQGRPVYEIFRFTARR